MSSSKVVTDLAQASKSFGRAPNSIALGLIMSEVRLPIWLIAQLERFRLSEDRIESDSRWWEGGVDSNRSNPPHLDRDKVLIFWQVLRMGNGKTKMDSR